MQRPTDELALCGLVWLGPLLLVLFSAAAAPPARQWPAQRKQGAPARPNGALSCSDDANEFRRMSAGEAPMQSVMLLICRMSWCAVRRFAAAAAASTPRVCRTARRVLA
jgi:hypothetical protein